MEKLAPPFLVSWNLTARCNLKCRHCYVDSDGATGTDAISTDTALRITNEIASLNNNAMLILTGGEPLLRPDIFDIASHASKLGLGVVIGTNGTYINETIVGKLADNRVKAVGISLDSATASFHDAFRGVCGSWQNAVTAMALLRAHSIDFQVQFTVTNENLHEIRRVAELSANAGARALNIFFLVCTGRGRAITDITPDEYEATLEEIVRVAEEFSGKIIVRPRCAPHFLRVASKHESELSGGSSGCVAGTSYLRITADGLVTPCPYIQPDINSPSLNRFSLSEIWSTSPVFKTLRNQSPEGRCNRCEWKVSCGGCRARALATSGNIMAEDPLCSYVPSENPHEKKPSPAWTNEALSRLEKVPQFLRPMIKTGIEKYALAKGLGEITPELMASLRQKAGR